MGFTLQGVGPFLHWMTMGALCVFPVLAALVIYKLGSLPGSIARASAGRCDQYLRLDGNHHDRAVADRDGVGASGAGQARGPFCGPSVLNSPNRDTNVRSVGMLRSER